MLPLEFLDRERRGRSPWELALLFPSLSGRLGSLDFFDLLMKSVMGATSPLVEDFLGLLPNKPDKLLLEKAFILNIYIMLGVGVE